MGWVLVFAYTLAEGLLLRGSKEGLLLMLNFNLLRFIEFYLCYLLLFPLWQKYRQLWLLGLGLLAVIAIFIVLRYTIEEVLFPVWFGFSNYQDPTLPFYIQDNSFYAMPGIFMAAAVYNLEKAQEKSQENLVLQQEKTKAELAFLKTQINPHFLYNTLNYIYSLAYPVSDKLASAIIKLSDLMRYMLHESTDGKVALQKEVEYLHNYIDIFRLRFEQHFFVDFTIEGSLNGQRVASLVLIQFVENALKHGVVNDPEAPVRISLQLGGSQLCFEVTNRIGTQQKDHTTGIGLANVRRRLDLLYPNAYNLEIQKTDHTYHTRLLLSGVK